LLTVAVNCCCVVTGTVAVVGLIDTEIGTGAALIVIVAPFDFVLSATEVAVSVTVAGDGTLAGAVYVTDVLVTLLSVPQADPVHPVPDNPQLTPLFCESFCTEAVKFAVVETCTEFDAGLTETEIGTVTVKLTALLATPPTDTTTLPEVAPVGTGTTMLVALQLVAVAAVPLKDTVLVPCDVPKLVPVMVTGVPTGPEVGAKLVMLGVPDPPPGLVLFAD
jgi:hypothetical protein